MPEEVVVIVLAGMGAVTWLGFGIMRTIGRHLERKHSGGASTQEFQAELDELRTRLDGVEDVRAHLAELEERLDFTERVLTRQGDQEGLPPPKSRRSK